MKFKPRNIFLLLIIFFFFTRLYHLTFLPIFTDESIYLYWSKYISVHHSNWFMSLTDGKPPLFIWIIAIFLKIFPSHLYLFAGRLVSVLAGGLTVAGVYKLSLLLFKSDKTSLLAVLFCITSPFLLFYDRMVLYDSLLSAMLIWSVYFSVKTSLYHQKKDAIIWGLFLGIAFLVKPPAIIFLLLTPVCFFILTKKFSKKTIFFPLIAVVLSELINNIQKFSANYNLASIKNQEFQLSFNQLISNPFILLEKNAKMLFDWTISYYTFPLLLLGFIGFAIVLHKHFRKGLILLILWITPIFIFACVGKILFPRYILFTTPYFFIAFAKAFDIFSSFKYIKNFWIGIIILLLVLPLWFDWYILTNPVKASFPRTDYEQYITSEYSGYGLQTIFNFLNKKLDQGPQIMLVTQGKFGLFPYAFKLNYWDDKRMRFYQAWLSDKLDVNVYSLGDSAKVYIVLWQNTTIPKNFPFRLLLKAEKPGGLHPILLAEPK